MGRRRRRGPGTAQRTKARSLGIPDELRLAGFDKRTVDAMNDESKRRFGFGIGVIVQEEERARRRLESLLPRRFWGRFSLGRWSAARRAKAERALWHGRLQEVADAVAEARHAE